MTQAINRVIRAEYSCAKTGRILFYSPPVTHAKYTEYSKLRYQAFKKAGFEIAVTAA